MIRESSPEPAHMLAVGDPLRAAMRRPVLAALLAGVVFSILTGPVKQVKPLYDHAPWLNDPFDVVVSFAMFFVPIATAFCLVRLALCRRFEPLPWARAEDLLRGCQVVLAVAALTLVTEWVSVAVGANRPEWNAATGLQVGLLALMTVLTGTAGVGLLRVRAGPRPVGAAGELGPDWLADVVVLAARRSHWLGPLQGPVLSALTWTDRYLLTLVRRHPVWSAAIVAAAFGVAAGGVQAIGEGYIAPAAVLTIILLGCGMFAFLVAAGSYLGLVRSGAALAGVRRRALDAGVLACFAVLVVLAFRNSLWWIVGSRAAAAGISQAYALLALSAVVVFAMVFAGLSLRDSRAATGR